MFGRAWYQGCPNVHEWLDLHDYRDLERAQIKSPADIKTFLTELISSYGVPMVNNGGQLAAYKDEWYDDEFAFQQQKGMKSRIEAFFDSAILAGVARSERSSLP